MGSAGTFVEPERGHSKTEIYNNRTSTWTSKKDYPYHKEIRAFEVVQFSSNFLVFGGFDQANMKIITIIAKFDPNVDEWSKMGNLKYARDYFGLIGFEDKYLVMYGNRDKRTEICEVTDDQIECETREPTVENYLFNPAMMVVPEDSVNQCKKQA